MPNKYVQKIVHLERTYQPKWIHHHFYIGNRLDTYVCIFSQGWILSALSLGEFRFNITMNIGYMFTILGFIFCLPLLIYNLYIMNKLVILWNGVYGTEFIPLTIAVDMLFVLYIFQCIKRCHDLGVSGLYSLIRNPFALLFLRGDEGENDYD